MLVTALKRICCKVGTRHHQMRKGCHDAQQWPANVENNT